MHQYAPKHTQAQPGDSATSRRTAASGLSHGLRHVVLVHRSVGNQAVQMTLSAPMTSVQRREVSGAPGISEIPPLANEALSAPGQPAAAATRAALEPRGGHDFSQVRVHAATNAALSTRTDDATRAFFEARNGLAMPAPLDGVRGIGAGQPLNTAIRAHFESLLGRDLEGVRVHTDQQASDLARSLGAVALTVGQDIAFREGAFAPATTEGRRLLGHELIHTVQQTPPSRSVPATASRVTVPEDAAEREADAGAAALVHGRPFTPVGVSSGVVARDVERPTTTLGRTAKFTQDARQLKATIPLPELFQGIDTRRGFRNRLMIRAVLMTAGGQPVTATERRAEITFDLWDEDYRVSVDGGPSTRYKVLEQALAPCWADIAFPSAVLAPGVSYVVTGEALLNLVSGAEIHRQAKEWALGRDPGFRARVLGYLAWKYIDVPADRADAWVAFRTQPFTAR